MSEVVVTTMLQGCDCDKLGSEISGIKSFESVDEETECFLFV